MPLFWKPYVSDTTRFIQDLKAANPALDEEQRKGRALLWDKPIDRDTYADFRASRVTQPAYVYFQPKSPDKPR